MRLAVLCIFLAALGATGCGKKKTHAVPVAAANPPSPPAASGRSGTAAGQPQAGQKERGVASWYGHPYHGRRAADGEIYDMDTLVAAHRTLPFQTMVRVRNLTNDKTVDVRIIDRGPFVNNRIIDLSHLAAQRVEMIGSGIAEVELTVLSSPAETSPAAFGVQVGAFAVRANADRLMAEMKEQYGFAREVERQGDTSLWRVVAGREASPEAAANLARRIRNERNMAAFVVRLDP